MQIIFEKAGFLRYNPLYADVLLSISHSTRHARLITAPPPWQRRLPRSLRFLLLTCARYNKAAAGHPRHYHKESVWTATPNHMYWP